MGSIHQEKEKKKDQLNIEDVLIVVVVIVVQQNFQDKERWTDLAEREREGQKRGED